MTNSPTAHSTLRQISAGANAPIQYSLSSHAPVILGRDLNCQIFLDPQKYQGVSRQHVEIRFLSPKSAVDRPVWQIRDLGSSNGTFINGQPLRGEQTLSPNDRIKLGRNGPEFVFECQLYPTRPIARPLSYPATNSASLHISQLVPILSTRRDLLKKAFLIPGILTVLLVVGLFSLIGQPFIFNALLAIYLAGAAYYFIYRLSGKAKPWWLIISMAIITMIILCSPLFDLFTLIFRQILPGNVPDQETSIIGTFIGMFFGAGLMEELLKAVPVFLALWLGTRLKSPQRERIGVWEPLDGILLATASAVGFTLLETLGQYVPNMVHSIATQSGAGAGELMGLQLLIPRILGSIAGHMAYSGYFGYFIGLSMLKRSKRWTILSIGWLTSALLHALWNTLNGESLGAGIGDLLSACVGTIAYMFLVAAILKARQLSPNRAQNFATQMHPPGLP